MPSAPTLTLVIALACAGCGDTISSNHATRAAAKQDIERGWIPSALPDSAVNIRESHNLDANSGHGTFAFSASDAEKFRLSLTPISAQQPLRTGISASKFERRGYMFYEHEDFDFAIDWNRRVGEFWLVYSRR